MGWWLWPPSARSSPGGRAANPAAGADVGGVVPLRAGHGTPGSVGFPHVTSLTDRRLGFPHVTGLTDRRRRPGLTGRLTRAKWGSGGRKTPSTPLEQGHRPGLCRCGWLLDGRHHPARTERPDDRVGEHIYRIIGGSSGCRCFDFLSFPGQTLRIVLDVLAITAGTIVLTVPYRSVLVLAVIPGVSLIMLKSYPLGSEPAPRLLSVDPVLAEPGLSPVRTSASAGRCPPERRRGES